MKLVSFFQMDAMNTGTLKQYYIQLIRRHLKKYNLHNYPSQLYNVDEFGILLDPKAPKVMAV